MSTQMQQLYQQVILDQSRARIGNTELLRDAAPYVTKVAIIFALSN